MGGICETYGALFWEKSYRRLFGNLNNVPLEIYRRRRGKIIK